MTELRRLDDKEGIFAAANDGHITVGIQHVLYETDNPLLNVFKRCPERATISRRHTAASPLSRRIVTSFFPEQKQPSATGVRVNIKVLLIHVCGKYAGGDQRVFDSDTRICHHIGPIGRPRKTSHSPLTSAWRPSIDQRLSSNISGHRHRRLWFRSGDKTAW